MNTRAGSHLAECTLVRQSDALRARTVLLRVRAGSVVGFQSVATRGTAVTPDTPLRPATVPVHTGIRID